MKRFLLTLTAFLFYVALNGQSAISGSWWGSIVLGPQKLNVSFDIIVGDDGNLHGLMDVPEQGARGIPVRLEKVTPDSLEIDIPAIGARYAGVRTSEEMIEGSFKQNGMSLKLDLQPGKIKVDRPQTPKPPYPFFTEEVTFGNKAEGALLSGTLTYPLMHFRYPAGTIPVVLMVTGSGGQNRDEELFDHKPFAVIAYHLALNGIATLRYDDRGVGKSTGSQEGTTTLNNKADADAGVEYLRSLGKFGKIGVLGHSEGGTIAFMMAADRSVDFIVSMAGAAAKGIDVLVGQNVAALKLKGLPDAVVDNYGNALRLVFNDRISGIKVEDGVRYVDRLCLDNDISLPAPLKDNLSQVAVAGGEWITWFLSYDPSEAIRRIECPVFALNGSHDLQVISKDNLAVISDCLPENSANLVKEYESLNHMFQHCPYQDALDYYSIEETMSEEVLNDIAAWIKSVK